MASDKRALIDQLAREIVEQGVGEELRSTATQLVMGSGNLNARVVLIGEAPGKQEDLLGMPFVGASGRFLDVMLVAAGLTREDLYITNIVKYRPPGNRDPLSSEKQEFWPYLMRQLDIINPKLVVTLGRHSLDCFLPGAKISQVHGGIYDYTSEAGQQFRLLPLYHPAAALYDGSMRQLLIDDFMKISTII